VTALVRQVQPSRPRPLLVTPWFVAVWSLMVGVLILGLAGVL